MKQLFTINFYTFRDPIEYSFEFMDHEENLMYGPIALEDLTLEDRFAALEALEKLKLILDNP